MNQWVNRLGEQVSSKMVNMKVSFNGRLPSFLRLIQLFLQRHYRLLRIRMFDSNFIDYRLQISTNIFASCRYILASFIYHIASESHALMLLSVNSSSMLMYRFLFPSETQKRKDRLRSFDVILSRLILRISDSKESPSPCVSIG